MDFPRFTLAIPQKNYMESGEWNIFPENVNHSACITAVPKLLTFEATDAIYG